MRVEIEKLSSEGFGEVKINGKKLFIPFTAPGDIVEVKKWRKEKKK
ncbi:23S rRNA (uracil-5-)-methyltransferase RumA, partial [Thermococci archaeon]